MLSYSLFDPPLPRSASGRRGVKRRVLITGAAGRIGSSFAGFAHRRYQLRLMIRVGQDPTLLRRFGTAVPGELTELEGLKKICRGIHTVVHLAAIPDPSALWEDLLRDNIIGTYNLFAAAKAAGCRRVIFASSIHAVCGYPPDMQVRPSDPVNPGDIYGVSKCFGEALGRYMAEQEDLSTIVLRIGGFTPLKHVRHYPRPKALDCLLTDRDFHGLLAACIDDTRLRFALLHAVSDNRFNRLEVSDARNLLGYAPRDDSYRLDPSVREPGGRPAAASMTTRGGQKSGMRREIGGNGKKGQRD